MRGKKVFKRLLPVLLVVLILIPAVVIAALIHQLFIPVDLQGQLEAVKQATIILDRNGQEVTSLYGSGRVWVSLTKMPLFLRQAVVATEDMRFYHHHGIDPIGIMRALYQDIRTGKPEQGGSTITQQLAKIALLTPEKTVLRKIEDIAYALRIERKYSKDQILEFYLNYIYLGHGAVGMEAAAQTNFGKHVWEINRKEAAMLAGLIRSPENYSPFKNKKASDDRTKTVLDLMEKEGYISADTHRAVLDEKTRLLSTPGGAYHGGYMVAHIVSELRSLFGWSDEYISRAGLEIHTTMDSDIQSVAEDTMSLIPVIYKDKDGAEQPQGGIVVLDPGDGEVLALVSGRDYRTAPLDRAAVSERQPGSAIKPFAYAAALEMGYSPSTIYDDDPAEFWVNGKSWSPKNYDLKYRGPVTLREALEQSINIVAARLVNDIGPQTVFDLARRMGLSTLVSSGTRNDVGLAPMALGGLTKGVTLLELTSAYSAFANGGLRVTPYTYTRVVDRQGKVIAANRPHAQRVLSAQTAYTITDMMQGVITRGTGIRAAIGRPAAGKTGTTSDYTNAWFIGYTPELLAGVWIGNDTADKPMKTDQGPLGSGMAAALWGELMNRVLAGKPVKDFPLPSTNDMNPMAMGPDQPPLSPTTATPAAPAAAESRPQPFSSSWWGLVRQRLRALFEKI